MTESNNTNEQEQNLLPVINFIQVDDKHLIDSIKYQILEGNCNPIEVYLGLKRLSKVVEGTIDGSKGDKELKEIFKNKVREYLGNEKSVTMFGANLSIRPTGTSYDFSECNDEYLNELYRIQSEVKELITVRENEIKAMLPPDDNKKLGIRTKTIVNDKMPSLEWYDHGQDSVIYPPIKKQGESIYVSFKK
jgi:hypothetical protein